MHDSLPAPLSAERPLPVGLDQTAAGALREPSGHGRRMLIIGNGPSARRLAERGFHTLPADVDTFGMGAAYRYFEHAGWWPTYYALADSKVVHSHRASLTQLIEDATVPTKRFYFSLPLSQSDRFVHIPHGSTGDFCFRKAIELGYREIYLIGIEGSYVEEIAESRPLTDEEFTALGFDALNLAPHLRKMLIITKTPESNPNYFFDDYQRAGDVYSLPQSTMHQGMWSRSASAHYAKGCKVYNLSEVSKITDFPVLPLEDFLAGHPTQSTEALEAEYQSLVASVPTKSPIFLPTERVALRDKVAGMRRVRDIYEHRLSGVYKSKLQALRQQFAGRQRCFVLGNGPSLNRTDLSALRNEVTFVTNGFFLKAQEQDWTPTFYVVEDHLVAEDRKDWIHAFKGPTKLFPAYLGYCLEEDDDTIFFNHRARKRAPHAFDFSRQADEITYAGCTVTFTCLQLAHYLGFKETYLLGVDADYAVPDDAKNESGYSVGVLDMKSDDPNHFHPDYFGKGFRWHDPQVGKMIQAYEEARRVVDATDQRIYNAGVGGRLEVFERRTLQSVLPSARTPDVVEAAAKAAGQPPKPMQRVSRAPKVLVFDLTPIGSGTATGELKATMLNGWPASSLMQVAGADTMTIIENGKKGVVTAKGDEGVAVLRERIAAFAPDVILYRPAAWSGLLHDVAQTIIRESGLPYVVWVMDDISTTIAEEQPERFAEWDRDWRALLAGASHRLSIGTAMSAAYRERYGLDFEPLANGIDPALWTRTQPAPPAGAKLKVRYIGSIVPYMQQEALRLVAEAVDTLALQGLNIGFEIRSRHEKAADTFRAYKHTTFVSEPLPPEEYRAWMQAADILLIGYNFDPSSADYTRYSVANKLPECMASGAALLAVGPATAATISYLADLDCGVRVTTESVPDIAAAIRALAENPERRRQLGEKAQRLAFERHSLSDLRSRFQTILADAGERSDLGGFGLPRSAATRVDETEVVSKLLTMRGGNKHVMLDVGAHHGGSAKHFHDLGWSIHCFEPDPANRAKLEQRFSSTPNITIDRRAVSDKPAKGVAFFSSEASTGISGLHAFHSTHQESARVDITTVTDIVKDRKLERVDFLKIDVEGFDFSVLKGVPWDVLRPDVIECEFEDAKTIPLGHKWREIADYLRVRGYAVYVSEWHPIIQYGGQHAWRRVLPYPGADIPSNAWGNLLAFREDPGIEAVQSAFNAVTRKYGKPKPKPAPKAPATAPVASARTPLTEPPPLTAAGAPEATRFYAPYAEQLRSTSPRTFLAMRFIKKTLGSLWRRRALTVPIALIFAAWTLAGFAPALSDWRWLIWASAAFGFLAACLAYIAFRMRQFVEHAIAENVALRHSLNAANAQIDALTQATQRSVSEDAKLSRSLAAMRSRGAQTADRLAHLSDMHEAIEARLAQLDAKEARLNAAITSTSAHLSEMHEAIETRFAQIDAKEASLSSDIASASERADAIQTRLTDSLQAESDALRGALDTRASQIEQSLSKGTIQAEERFSALDAKLKAQASQLATTDKFAVFNNAAYYQRFNRRLNAEHIEVLQRWASGTAAKATKQPIGYAAHRACLVEARMHGRLAAGIEDILLRTFAAMTMPSASLNVLEIGSLFGISAGIMYDLMAPHYDDLHFTLLDPLDGYYNSDRLDVLTGQPISEQTLRKNLAEVGLSGEKLTLIKHLSTEEKALKLASEREYDVLIIDGDHTFDGVKADFDLYMPMVRRGGIIIFDDYDQPDWPDVKRFVDEQVQPLDVVAKVGHEWRTCVYRKVRSTAKPRQSAQESE